MKIPKIKKLPSGAYNCRVRVGGREYSITDIDKDKVYAQAVAYKKGIIKAKRQPERITVKEAVERYIEDRQNILSPSTLREYGNSIGTAYAQIAQVPLDQITKRVLQRWVNDYARSHSPKTVRDKYNLLAAALKNADLDESFRVTLPEQRPARFPAPDEKEIALLIKSAEGTDMELPILLAATGSLRRSEICALTRSDVTATGVTVDKALVRDKNNQWVIKPPKEASSARHALLPAFVLDKLRSVQDGEPITRLTPNQITKRWEALTRRHGITRLRFHDLRAYWATVAHASGMPDYYIMRNGGWSSMETPRKHYMRDMSPQIDTADNAVQAHFSAAFGDENGDEK